MKHMNRIKQVLKEKNKTGKWLYEKMGVGKMTVSRWMRNENQPSLENLFEISILLNCDISELLISSSEYKRLYK